MVQVKQESVGIIGLGKMGKGVAKRCVRSGLHVYGYDPHVTALQLEKGVRCVPCIATLIKNVSRILILVPAGDTVDEVLAHIVAACTRAKHSSPLCVIDGGNSYYKDSIKRAALLKNDGISFLDCGISGGLHGVEDGYCVMVGGDVGDYLQSQSLFKAFAMDDGLMHVGAIGSGHYAKMVHNGVEYALMQAYAEGFHLLKEGAFPNIDLVRLAATWNRGSIIRSRLLSVIQEALKDKVLLAQTSGVVHENGTGRWTVQEAHEQRVPTPIIKKAVAQRSWSRESGGNTATALIALMRHVFGGHPIEYRQEDDE